MLLLLYADASVQDYHQFHLGTNMVLPRWEWVITCTRYPVKLQTFALASFRYRVTLSWCHRHRTLDTREPVTKFLYGKLTNKVTVAQSALSENP